MSVCVDSLTGTPLSMEQLRLWRCLGDCPAQTFRSYAIAAIGNCDFSDVRRAFEIVVRDHDQLRCRLVNIPGMVYPVLMEGGACEYHDLGDLGDDLQSAIDTMARALASCTFALEETLPAHLLLGRLARGGVLLGLTMPAFLGDGASVDLVLRKTARLIAGGIAQDDSAQSRAASYRKIHRWREQILAAAEANTGQLLWRERLAACERSSWDSIIPGIAISDTDPSADASPIRGIRGALALATIAKFARGEPRVARAYLFAAWYLLLWKLGNCPREFLVASCFDGRSMEDLAGAVGPLERFLPLGVALDASRSLRELCDELVAQFDEAEEWQDCFSWSSFDAVEDSGAAIRSFDHCFEFITVEPATTRDARCVSLRRFSRSERYKLKLDVTYTDGEDGEVALHYDVRHISQRHAQQLLDTYTFFLMQAAADDAIRLLDMQWSETKPAGEMAPSRADDAAEYVTHRFRRMAGRYRDRVALASREQSLSYAQLDWCTDVLALRIGCGTDSPESSVAVVGATSFHTVMGLLATLKAGHCFVHIDPECPRARVLQVLRECGAKVVLYDETATAVDVRALGRGLGLRDEAIIAIAEAIADGAGYRDRASSITHPAQLAYVAYTSGSTGAPHGVMISHGSLANQIGWLARSQVFSSADVWLLKTPLSFDASVWEWLTPLCIGATLVCDGVNLHLQPANIVANVRDHRVTVLQVVPNLIRILLGEAQPNDLASLRHLFAGGEQLPADACHLMSGSQARLINLYGPTETTINATWWVAPRDFTRPQETSIGQPVTGMSAHVLDPLGQELPCGFIGELHLTGTGLARGYAQQPDTTAAKFIPSPFGSGQRMYRTGDLVSRDEHDNLFYWGRRDNQVKLRGYRIDLGEIEAVLAAHAAVKTAAACILAGDGTAANSQLIAYVVLRDATVRPSTEELRDHLRSRLPEYMVPASTVVLNALPLKPSGKIDRRKLESPEFTELRRCDAYVAPQTETQKKLCAIWQRLLEVDRVGIGDDFLQLGGQSLLVTRLVGYIDESLGIEISPRLVFDYPVLRDFAAQLDLLAYARTA